MVMITIWLDVNRVKLSKQHELLEDIFEDVLEFSVVSFENSVFGAHVKWPPLQDSILETAVGKVFNSLKYFLKLNGN